MKKKILALLLVMAMGASVVACGNKQETETAKTDLPEVNVPDTGALAYPEYNVLDYVTLGQYDNLEVEVELPYPTVEDYIVEALKNAGIDEYVRDDSLTEVVADSIVNVNYKGIKDGVAFDGGTAENVTIDMVKDESRYIDGFVSSLLGAHVGDEFGAEVTFPENYGSAELAGQTVTFEFKINYLNSPIDLKNFSAEVMEALDAESAEEFYAEAEANMKAANDASYQENLVAAVGQAIVDGSTVNSYPEGLVEYTYANILKFYEENYVTEETTLEDMAAYYGQSLDEFKESLKSQAEDYLRIQLIFEAVAAEKGITVTEEQYQGFVSEICEANSLEEPSMLYYYYGSVSGDGEEYLRNIFRNNAVMDECAKTAVAK